MHAAEEYARKVLNREIPAGKLVRRACKRHLRDLKRSEQEDYPYYFDDDAANKVINFCQFMFHVKGDMRGQPFEPMQWQKFILGSIFGWKQKKDRLRRFRYAYVEVPRKNGKSFLASVIALYMLIADGEGGAEVYAAATKKEQAKIVWETSRDIVKGSPALSKHVSEKYFSLIFSRMDAKYLPLASDSKTLDGLNPSCSILDEIHEWKDRTLWDVLEDAYGARSQPLQFAITTAGYNKNGICYEQRTHAVNMLEGGDDYVDDTLFAYIATVDDPEKWDDPKEWAKANPCLGVAKSIAYMEDQVNKAKLMPAKENTVKNKQLNIWTDGQTKWLNMAKWDKCAGEIDREALRGRKCFLGLDLSSKIDITAAVLVFPPNDVYSEYTIVPFFWIPEENMRERSRRDRVPYEAWHKAGLIEATEGDIIDLDHIYNRLKEIAEDFEIQEIGFDPWKAIEIATKLAADGFDMVQMRQGHATLGAPTSELEVKVINGNVRHGGHPVLRWMATNTIVLKDSNDNIRPDKSKSAEKIDGIVALIMGLGRSMVSTKAEVAEPRIHVF